jgi:hypothetical protein
MPPPRTVRSRSAGHGSLADLADRLISNHLRSSQLPESGWKRFSQSVRKYKDHRVIVVVGAGASEVLPNSAEAIERAKKRVVTDKTIEDEVRRERDRLTRVFDQDPAHFDTELAAMSVTRWREQIVRDTFAEIFRHRFVPLLQYELVAHLFKHRFVDVVVNFNFDELLDQAIADELNQDEYARVVSEGDVPLEGDDVRIYMKPHGTAAVPSSMRFTRDHYWSMPASISTALGRVCDSQPVVVLAIGYSFRGFDLNECLNQAPPASELYCFDRGMPKPTPKLKRLTPRLIPVAGNDLPVRIGTVWKLVHKKLSRRLPVRGVARHELVARLFGHRREAVSKAVGTQRAELVDYFRDRTLIEICLSFAKGKGLVTVSQLATDRSGIYFGHYAEHHRSGEGVSLTELCDHLHLEGVGYGHEAMTYRPDQDRKRRPRVMTRMEFKAAISDILELLVSSKGLLTTPVRAELQRASTRRLFVDTMSRLYEADEVEFRSDRSVTTRALFRKAVPLDNATAVHWRTRELLRARDYNTLLLVAETGEWLLKESGVVDPRRVERICLIVADTTHEVALRKRFKGALRIRRLNWWDHNRHMTIAVDGQKAVRSIYFPRRMRASSVSPVLLDELDSKVLLELFVAYWSRAASGRPGGQWIGADEARNVGRFFESLRAERGRP